VAAFEADSRVQAEIDALAKTHEPKGKPHSIMVSGLCGVVGCSRTDIVIQVMKTSGANTQTNYVAATVAKGIDEKLKVQVVRFMPANGQ
jgi:hypothetical protein